VYAGGVLAGLVPLALYNLWAFGSVTHMSYSDAVKVQGLSGHAVLGLNDGGFFGIGMPTPHRLAQLLFAPRGLLVLSPVLALGAVGTVLLYRRGRRAEALTIAAVALSYLVYNAGYYLPFGGGSPGPRFLIPMLPFLAVPLGLAFRRFPALTLALAIPSAGFALVSTTTMPLIGFDWAGYWAFWLGSGTFEHTIATVLGAGNGWGGLAPFIVAVGAAVALAVAASDRLTVAGDALYALTALLVWACVALAAPGLLAEGYDGQYANGWQALVATFGAAAFTLVAASALLERRPWREWSLASVARREQIDHEPVPAYSSQRQSP
jgi:hypothetical protein